MLDTYTKIWSGVRLRCPAASSLLAKQWVSHAFRRIAERRLWSWLIKQDQFLIPQAYTTGTVNCTRGNSTVTGIGTNWLLGPTTSIVGQQFRIGTQAPIYTIASVTDGTTLVLDIPWGFDSQSSVGYEIYQPYVPVPTDFLSFVSVIDPRFNWQLNLNYTSIEIDRVDPQRSNRGNAYAITNRDYFVPVGQTIPVPRYELWPHQRNQYVYPYMYISRPVDLEDAGATLPRYIRGDVLLDMALAEAARWPGPSPDKPNPFFNLTMAAMYDKKTEMMIAEMERQDDEIYEMDAMYQLAQYPYAPYPMDSAWLQKHDFPAY
jgi:hypothetical protein